MGTRGLLGIRNNKKLLYSIFNAHDSYYSYLGKEVIDYYFDGSGFEILSLREDGEEDKLFLQDGLFCEYAYIYNEENDTLEIYRGFFKNKQFGENTKKQILRKLNNEEKWFCHLIIIIDKKIHTKEKVLKAFKKYDDLCNEEEVFDYPERKIIPLIIPKNYRGLV